MNYKDAGVDLEEGRKFVKQIKEKVPSIGGFGGMMKVPSGYKNPVLVSGTDGVGTKLGIVWWCNNQTSIGVDLVAMCVNDVITCGAKPLYFLDYIATGSINSSKLDNVIDGIIDGCKISGCEFLGGETAELPGMFTYVRKVDGIPTAIESPRYDLAGFCTGIVEEEKIIDGSTIQSGDVVIGIQSNGVHSNGYSIINVLYNDGKLAIKDYPSDDPRYVSSLVTPTLIYVPVVQSLISQVNIKGMAHITGGGIPENLPRCLPEGITVDVDYDSWERPDIFKTIADLGNVSEEEMRNVFNLGIGYCVVVSKELVTETQNIISSNGLKSWVIGTTK